MFVEDLKNDFYFRLLDQRVLVLVHADVDSVCAWRVLQALLRVDDAAYAVALIRDAAQLQRAYSEHAARTTVLLNCGGTTDLVALLQPPDDAVLFVLDSHKPSHVCNVYSDSQVRLVQRDAEEEVPDFEQIFRDEDDELTERQAAAWEARRDALMFSYTQFSWTGRPSALVLLELAWRLGRADAASTWAAAVAAEASAALCLRTDARALLDTAPSLRHHVARLQHAASTPVSVREERDVRLPLYRSWTLEAAVRHAPALAPALRLHTPHGDKRLRQLLADMGFPLAQARQSYRAMDVALRRELPGALSTAAAKHALPALDYTTHILRRPLASALPALDLVYTIMALLEQEGEDSGILESCVSALEVCEAGEGVGAMAERGAESARARLGGVARAVHNTLAHKQLHSTGPFQYFVVPEGCAEARVLGRPLWLGEAVRWAASARGGGGTARPLLACAPSADVSGSCLVVGLPPKHKEEPRNLLGAAFEQAAAAAGLAPAPLFHPAAIVFPAAALPRFLDSLTQLLA